MSASASELARAHYLDKPHRSTFGTASMPLRRKESRPFSVTLDGPLSVLRGRNAVCWHLTAFIALDARYLDIIVGIPTLEV